MSRYLKGRDYALKLVAAQFALSLLMGAVGSAVTQKVGLSLMIGGAISVAANTWMALVAFRPQLSAPVAKMLIAFYLGEMGKFVVTALLFLLAFKTLAMFKDAIHAFFLLLGYVLTQFAVWIYPLLKK